jgi:hypothetical protein
MSWSRTRARKRRARLEKVRAEFQEKRQDPGALEDLLREHAESSLRLWDVARPAAGDKPLDDAERAMIAQVVAPRLAGMTPGSVRRRQRPGSDLSLPARAEHDVARGQEGAAPQRQP